MCGIIVTVSHRIRLGQNTEWRQDNQLYTTLREKRALAAKRHRPERQREYHFASFLGMCLRCRVLQQTHWSLDRANSHQSIDLCPFGGLYQSMISPYFHPELGPLWLLLDTHVGATECFWIQLWHVLATICHTRTWADRNAAVYQRRHYSPPEQHQ